MNDRPPASSSAAARARYDDDPVVRQPVRRESLGALLGGRGGALDASVPPLGFVLGWLLSDGSIGWGAVAALLAGSVVGILRLTSGQKARSVVLSLAAVAVAALVALYTGRPEDFFLLQLLANGASALVWAASIVLRWPLLGVVVGALLGQKAGWRKDPALLRAYSLASWVWVFGQYTVRVLVFGALWWSGQVVALGIARTVLTWPLVALTVACSGWVLHRALPDDHPGIRHPQDGTERVP